MIGFGVFFWCLLVQDEVVGDEVLSLMLSFGEVLYYRGKHVENI